MVRKKGRRSVNSLRKKSEWYILSIVLLAFSLSILALKISPESFGFTSTLVAIGGMGLSLSDRWKLAGDEFHQIIVGGSVLLIAGCLLAHALARKNSV